MANKINKTLLISAFKALGFFSLFFFLFLVTESLVQSKVYRKVSCAKQINGILFHSYNRGCPAKKFSSSGKLTHERVSTFQLFL